jgi:hypothetical protein
MATLSSMTDEVKRKLAGYTLRQDRQTYLTSALTSSGTSIAVDAADNISSGVIEIDEELIYVNSYNRTGKTLDVKYGRGHNGTIAKIHAVGSRVIFSPTFPSLDVKDAINETIMSVFPDLYTMKSHTFSHTPTKSTYALPNDAVNVYSVSYEVIGPSKEWIPIRSYRVDNMANVNSFESNNSISIYSGVQPGRTVQVVYTTDPDTMENPNDDFELTTGLPASCKDVIIFGAAARLVSFIDPGRKKRNKVDNCNFNAVPKPSKCV